MFFGAAAKGCVFLNALGINIGNMSDSYVVDDTLEKVGLFVPGTGFEIVNRETLEKDQVKNIIILAHNFKEYIKDSLINKSKFSGRLFVMLPHIEEI